uniref:Uncharacterized protein n=1 Tax=Magallana gigas TaxID=29159 RepID=A0A8W8P684_MAGGI
MKPCAFILLEFLIHPTIPSCKKSCPSSSYHEQLKSTTTSTSVNSNVDISSYQNNGEYADFTNLYEDDNVPYLVGEVEAQYTEPSPTDSVERTSIQMLSDTERWMPRRDHPYCDIGNNEPITISSECQTDISFGQMECMERCVNDKDSFLKR